METDTISFLQLLCISPFYSFITQHRIQRQQDKSALIWIQILSTWAGFNLPGWAARVEPMYGKLSVVLFDQHHCVMNRFLAKASSSPASWARPLCFIVNHICLCIICCTKGVLSNIVFRILQRGRERGREWVKHRASHSSGVKNVTSCAFLSQITGAIPLPPYLLSFFFLPSASFCLSHLFVIVSLFFFFALLSCSHF